MAQQKYYAVKNGREIGIYRTWDECQKHTIGFSGAMYKSFKTLEEAEDFMNTPELRKSERFKSEQAVLDSVDEGVLVAYVDGSNTASGKLFSWGVITFSHELGKISLSGSSNHPEYIRHRNVSGEIQASTTAIQFALDNGFDKVVIYHDYENIRYWALNELSAKNEMANEYIEFCTKAKEEIDLEFVKVDGHSGDKFNEEADILAKKTLGIR